MTPNTKFVLLVNFVLLKPELESSAYFSPFVFAISQDLLAELCWGLSKIAKSTATAITATGGALEKLAAHFAPRMAGPLSLLKNTLWWSTWTGAKRGLRFLFERNKPPFKRGNVHRHFFLFSHERDVKGVQSVPLLSGGLLRGAIFFVCFFVFLFLF